MGSEDPTLHDNGREVQGSPETGPASSRSEDQPQSATPSGVQGEDWRERALRLQAEMENYRKRQQWLADERVQEERERLLRAILSIADDLERALGAQPTDVSSLHQGVGMTYRAFIQILEQEGVKQIEAQGQLFDPEQHEAVGAVPVSESYPHPQTVVEVVRPGYRLGERLLRPSQVLVSA